MCQQKGAYTSTHPYSKGSSLLCNRDVTNPCRPSRAPHRRCTIILNSAMNLYLISNMCASVHADFCRPKGLESAQTRPSTYSAWNCRGYHNNVWKNSVLFSVWKNNPTPIPFALAVLNILNIFTLVLSQRRSRISAITLALIFIMTIDRPCRQCSRSSMSVIVVSQHESSE